MEVRPLPPTVTQTGRSICTPTPWDCQPHPASPPPGEKDGIGVGKRGEEKMQENDKDGERRWGCIKKAQTMAQ